MLFRPTLIKGFTPDGYTTSVRLDVRALKFGVLILIIFMIFCHVYNNN